MDWAAAISGAALLAEAQGEIERAQRLHEDALAIRREARDASGIARSLTGLGVIARLRGDLKFARTLHQDAMTAWREAGDTVGAAGALLNLGSDPSTGGRLRRCRAETARRAETSSDNFVTRSGEAYALNLLGSLATATGSLPKAIELFGESLRLWRTLGNQQMIAADLHNLGEAHHLSGSLDEAENLYQDALTRFEVLGDPRGRGFVLNELGLLALDRGDVADSTTFAGREPAAQVERWLAGCNSRHARGAGGSHLADWRSGSCRNAAPDSELPAERDRRCAPAGLRRAVSAGVASRQRSRCGGRFCLTSIRQ